MNEIPEGFDLKLAIVDAIPVIEFSITMILIGSKFNSILFIIGALLCTIAGCGKVLWKLILALFNKNIMWFNKQFRYSMSSGFIVMIISIIINRDHIHLINVISFPSIIFFILMIIGMIILMIMAKKLDKMNSRHNWYEQFMNIFMQTMFLLGVLYV